MDELLDYLGPKYDFLGKLGEGGMGSVFRVRHRILGEQRVVKMLHRDLAGDPRAVARFRREARALSELRHENLARVYDVHIGADVAFIVMELVDGISLRTLKEDWSPLPSSLVVALGSQILEAMAVLHDNGYVHRDISPDNVMVTGEQQALTVKLIDLGVAKAVKRASQEVTVEGSFLGKLRYASPEQLSAADLDGRSDLYSFGVMLYELLTDRYPIRGNSPESWVTGHLKSPPAPFLDQPPDSLIPLPLRRALLQCLAKEREQRPPNARALGRAFEDFAGRDPLADQDRVQALAAIEKSRETARFSDATETLETGGSQRQERARLTVSPASWVPTRSLRGSIAAWVLGAAVVSTGLGLLVKDRWTDPQSSSSPRENAAAAIAAQEPVGSLLIDAIPWARITDLRDEAGRRVEIPGDAITPMALSLPRGRYRLELTGGRDRDEGSERKIAWIEVHPDARTDHFEVFGSPSVEDFLRELGW